VLTPQCPARRRRPHISALRVFLLGAVALTIVATTGVSSAGARTVDAATASASHTSRTVSAHRSERHYGWSSGVYPGKGIDLAAARVFARYVGRPLNNVHVFVEPSTWHEIGYDNWEVRQYAGFKGQLIIDLPLLPEDQPASLAAVAQGRYDRYFTAMARKLRSSGRANSVLVLGSEFNGDWQTYSAFKPHVYKAAFRHVVKLLRRISPKFVIDWTGNAIDNQSGHNPFRSDYPGNRYVDVIGVDAYAYAESKITGPRSFARWASLPFGVKAWARFARNHHKKFSIPEWGLTSSTSQWGSPTALGSGDVPAYVKGMYRLMRTMGPRLAFEDYFNQPASGEENSLNAPNQVPHSSRRYQSLWSKLPKPAHRFVTGG
jgi:hypothetical protein